MDRYTDYYHILKALIDKGIIKMERFAKSKNKLGYVYVMTPKGINEKTKITKHFIARKSEEFELLKREIAEAEAFLSGDE